MFPSKRFLYSSIFISILTLSMSAWQASAAANENSLKSKNDPHTAAALRRAALIEGLKPITQSAGESSAAPAEDEIEKIKKGVGLHKKIKVKDLAHTTAKKKSEASDSASDAAEKTDDASEDQEKISRPKVTTSPALPVPDKVQPPAHDKAQSNPNKTQAAPDRTQSTLNKAQAIPDKAPPVLNKASPVLDKDEAASDSSTLAADKPGETHATDNKTNAHANPTEGVSAETSLKWLTNGNTRFLKKRFRADGRSAEDRKRLTAGQKPHAIILSCSDSRVPPEIVFDQALGEIFVIRVAGEALDSSVIGSIEYAVEHFGTHLILVMGHSQCGAVTAAIQTKEGDSTGSPDLDKIIADIRPRLKTVKSEVPSASVEVESALNADGVARDLVKRSEVLRKKVENGELTIKSALYRMESGKVSFY